MRSVRVLTLGVFAVCTGLSLQAQCYEPLTGSAIGGGDDVVLSMQSLGFAFPFGGATYTDVHVETNGRVCLSNAGVPAPALADWTPIPAELVAGSPKIAPYWSDLNVITGTGNVLFNALPGKAVITWENAVEYGSTDQFSVQLQLLASGEIFFAYDGRCAIRTAGDFIIGTSEGGGAVIPAVSDLSVVGTSTTTTTFEIFNNVGLTYDLGGKTVQFVPSGLGYTWIPQGCAGGHAAYGTGCYENTNDSVYQLTTAPAASSAALSNTAITMIPTAGSYLVIGTGTFVAPTGAAQVLALTDDSVTVTPTLTTPFPYPGGSTPSFQVCSNGSVWVAPGNSVAYAPVAATMLNNPETAWYSWHDYNPAAAGSGSVKFEQVGSVAYITWDGVYNFSGTTVADASTFQFQFDSSTGYVTIAWQTMSANTHTLAAGEPHLVGFSPGGASFDNGPVTFATAMPIQVVAAMRPLTLAAAPSPISTPSSGSASVYTTSNIPEFAPGAGIYIALNIMSVGQVPAPGLDLGFLGAPGCAVFVASIDLTQSMVGLSSSQTVTLTLPAGVPQGLQVFSQSAALVAPNSLPNGQNAFGMTTSNAIASTIGAW